MVIPESGTEQEGAWAKAHDEEGEGGLRHG